MVSVKIERAIVVIVALACLSVATSEDVPRWVLSLASALVGAAVMFLAVRAGALAVVVNHAPEDGKVVPLFRDRDAKTTEGD